MGGGGIRAGRLGVAAGHTKWHQHPDCKTDPMRTCSLPTSCMHASGGGRHVAAPACSPPISISAPPTCLPNTPAPTCDVGKRDAPLEGRCPEVDGLQLQRAGRSGAVRAAQGRPAAGSCSRHVAGSGQRPGSPTLGPAGWFHSIRSFWPSDGAEADMAAGWLRSWLHRVVKVHGAGQ